jgi:hypothetical protein
MARNFYRVGDTANFGVERWIHERDTFAYVHPVQPRALVITPLGGAMGFPLPPTQKIICEVETYTSDGRMPSFVAPTDFKTNTGDWIISDRLRQLFATFDPDAFSFIEIEMKWRGWKGGRVAWLCRIMRSFEPCELGDIPDDAHAFSRSKNLGIAFFDDALKDAIIAQGMKGFRFRAIDRL